MTGMSDARDITPQQTAGDPGDKPKKRWSRRRKRIVAALLAVLVLYPLSIGPAYLWASRSGDPSASAKLLDTGYAPLIWICGRSQWAQNALDRYCGIW